MRLLVSIQSLRSFEKFISLIEEKKITSSEAVSGFNMINLLIQPTSASSLKSLFGACQIDSGLTTFRKACLLVWSALSKRVERNDVVDRLKLELFEVSS